MASEELSNVALARRYTIKDRGFYIDDDIYVQESPGLDEAEMEDLMNRLAQPTMSNSAKLYPRRLPSSPALKLLLEAGKAPFANVSPGKMKEIQERLCRPTFSSSLQSTSAQAPPSDLTPPFYWNPKVEPSVTTGSVPASARAEKPCKK